MKHEKTYLLGIILLFLIAFSPNVFAIIFNGTGAGSVFSSDSAFGSIVEKEVNYVPTGSEPSWSAILFSWGGPLANATGAIDVATAGFGVSAIGDILVLTMGPELEEEEPVVEKEKEKEEIKEKSSVPSSGGGGGGSSSRDTYGLIIGDKLTVLINGESHTIDITEIRETSAVLTIESTKIVIEINEGETQEIDLDEDGVADMGITLDDVSELRKIIITVEDLTIREEAEAEVVEQKESILAEPLKRITGAVSAMNIDTEAIKEVKQEVEHTTNTVVKYVLLMNLVVGAILGTVIAAREMHRRRIYKFFHQKSREDVVRDKMKELEMYVQKAYDERMSFEEIKEALLNVGWYEYEIDEVITNVMFQKENSLVIT